MQLTATSFRCDCRQKAKVEKVKADMTVRLGLASLKRHSTVSDEQFTQCCEKLRDMDVASSLRDCRLEVTHYYSVMEDGQLCIPWNYFL